jgi:glyceraldehyde-3-phosphate dehydrogenase/erythrose-4-phosphate dehydrogenase
LAGIVKGTMTTTHSYTGDQVTVKNSVLCWYSVITYLVW